jgi:GNAT superfamily N-acetyltransferase
MEEKAAFDINVVKEERNEVYTAIVGDTALGAITYSHAGDRIVLLAAAVYPEFRRQGVATEMIPRSSTMYGHKGRRRRSSARSFASSSTNILSTRASSTPTTRA